MEIKKGDKVRVSKDAPKMYVPVSFWTEGNSIVEEIHEGNAAICYESNYVDFRIVVPIKYLLVNVNGVWKKPKTKPKRTRKVDAEAKEPKYKIGDKIRVCDPNLACYGFIGRVTKVKDGLIFATDGYGIDFTAKESCLERVQSKEQTDAEKPNHTIAIPVEVDLKEVAKEYAEAMSNAIGEYGDALCKYGSFIRMADDLYKRDLAKEVALKVANKFNDPEQAAAYAVKVAKAVVEGLKMK